MITPSATQEKIIRAVKCMDDKSASEVWAVILKNFEEYAKWALIPEEEPDEFDLYMLNQIESDPDCHDFVNSAEIKGELKPTECRCMIA